MDFCKYVLNHDAFISGEFDTNFIKHYFESPEIVYTAMEEEENVQIPVAKEVYEPILTELENYGIIFTCF